MTADDVEAIATWDAKAEPSIEIPFQPARAMQDFTGVPAVVDLAAMRDAMEELGGDPAAINPQVDVDLIIDHSVQVDAFGNARAFEINEERDYERNGERYASCAGGRRASTTSGSSCPRPGSAIRSTSSTSGGPSGRVRWTGRPRPIPTPSSAQTRTPR